MIVAVLILRGRTPERKVQPLPDPKPPIVIDNGRESEVQLATATTLADVLAERKLTPSETSRLADANRQLDVARQRIAAKDYAAALR